MNTITLDGLSVGPDNVRDLLTGKSSCVFGKAR
jgi:hypothetical protein